MEPFAGSVEVIVGDESRGIPGVMWTVEAVPAVVGPVAGITGLVETTPEPQPGGRTPEAQWTGEDAHGFPVTVLLWRMPPADLHGPLFPNPEEGG